LLVADTGHHMATHRVRRALKIAARARSRGDDDTNKTHPPRAC
jgi:hypothetical protein